MKDKDKTMDFSEVFYKCSILTPKSQTRFLIVRNLLVVEDTVGVPVDGTFAGPETSMGGNGCHGLCCDNGGVTYTRWN